MKKILVSLVVAMMILTGCGAVQTANNNSAVAQEAKTMQIKILIGEKTFDAVLVDNAAARAFYEKLPLSVTMVELNGNEKFFNLGEKLPSLDKRVDNMQEGDLMLWSANTVVLFYKSFHSGYNYTRLGKIKNPAGLLDAAGSGNISVKFEK